MLLRITKFSPLFQTKTMKQLQFKRNYPILKHTLAFGLILLLMIFIFVNKLPAEVKSNMGISIVKITVGEDSIETGREQLIEVLVKNTSEKSVTINCKLSIVLPNHNIVSAGDRTVLLKERSENRVLITYPIDKNRGGDYTVGAKLFTTDGKLIIQNSESQLKFFFAVDPTRKNQQSTRQKSPNTVDKTKTMDKEKPVIVESSAMFDPPDLTIDTVTIPRNNSVIRGETSHIRIVISNQGGDVAKDVDFSVYWYFAPRKNRMIKFFEDKVEIIAPGERKYIEIPITIPETEQKGEYFVYTVVDESNQIKELNEKNNQLVSDKSIIFSDIALVFPDDQHSFAEDGLFKFEWRSRRFNQFKVQISANELFGNPEDIFELPKGENAEGWTAESTLKPLPGEMPAMALALMETNGIDYLYWRVKAKDSEGATTESAVRKFFISLKADL